MKRRFYDLDVCRCLLIITLPFIHIVEFLGDMYGYSDILSIQTTTSFNIVAESLCIFVAPMFVIFTGINMINTSKKTPLDFVKRGVLLVIMELALNLIRYEIPGAISLSFVNSNDGKKIILDSMLLGILNSDVLALTALSFFTFALFKKLKLKPWVILIIAICLFSIDFALNETVMHTIDSKMNSIVSNILGNLIYINANSTFPLTEWLIFVSVGYLFGIAINKFEKKNEMRLFAFIGIASLIIFVTCLLYSIFSGLNVIESICQAASPRSMTPLCLFAELSCSFLFISIVYWACYLFKLNKHQKACEFVKNTSNKTTPFYIIQWTIVGWIMMISAALAYGSKIIPLWATLLLFASILIISYLFSDSLKKGIKKFSILLHLE